ncbi:hypothetical protein P4O66_006927, partial [Electrophorus voltai]
LHPGEGRMFRDGPDTPHPSRSTSRFSKHVSHVSSFKALSLVERRREPLAPPSLQSYCPSAQPQPEAAAPGKAPDSFPDYVYLRAAAIFQSLHQEKAASHRLISYGTRSEVKVPEVKDEVLHRLAYELAFNTLKCKEECNTVASVWVQWKDLPAPVLYQWDQGKQNLCPVISSVLTLSCPFAYRPNRSTDDAISTTLHLALTHLDKKGTYIRMLFTDFSSAFNTIVPQHLIGKLSLLGLNTCLCNWILDFLTEVYQSVRIGSSTSNTTTLSTGAPQGSVLSPLLFTLLTHDCAAMHSSNHIIKFADDTTVRRTWTLNTSSITKRAQQCLYFLRKLRKAHLPSPILTTFYRDQELLEDIMMDSCFYLFQPMANDLMSLVAVMLYDFLDRKFRPREQLANQKEGAAEPSVREVEECLFRFKTKLEASLARCRIKHHLLTIQCILPKTVQQRQERASNLPLYAWVNTLRASMEEVCDELKSAGFSRVTSVGQLEGQTFCKDPHCMDVLVFPACVREELCHNNLLSEYKLIVQDKSCCVGPWAVRPLLEVGRDVLVAGSFSASTLAHLAAIVAGAHTHAHTHTTPLSGKHTHGSARVLVCGGELSFDQKHELQEVLSSMACSSKCVCVCAYVKLLPEALRAVSVSDVRVQRVQVILLMPHCSLSALSNPLDYILQESGDTELLKDLSQGVVSQARLHTLISQQRQDLQHALQFPKVQAVVYSTCSSFPEENEEVVQKALSLSELGISKRQPFRLSSPSLPQYTMCGDEDRGQSGFFKLEASDQSNGCFLAVLTRQDRVFSEPEWESDQGEGNMVRLRSSSGNCRFTERDRDGAACPLSSHWLQSDPEVTETAQEVVARATTSGLLDGIQPSQPIKKQGRGRQTRKGPSFQAHGSDTRPRVSLSGQSQLAEFLSQEMKASRSAPALTQEMVNAACSLQGKKVKPTYQHSSKLAKSGTGSASCPALASSPPCKNMTRRLVNSASALNPRAPPPVAPPPCPPKSRQEVLRPVALMFPPMLFPGLPPFSV